jgi:hypothetical protein
VYFGNEFHLILLTLVTEGNLFLQGLLKSLQIRNGPLHQLIDLFANILKTIVLDEGGLVVLVEPLQVLLVNRDSDLGMKVAANLGHVLRGGALVVIPLIHSLLIDANLGGDHIHLVIKLRNQRFEDALFAFSIKLVGVMDDFENVFVCAVDST